MTIGEQLLIACLKTRDSRTLSAINKKWLDGVELKQHKFILDYYKEFGEHVGIRTFCREFKVSSSEVDAKPAHYLTKLQERYIFATISEEVPRLLKGVRDEPRKRLSDLQELVSSLSGDTTGSRDTLYSENTEKRKTEYEDREKTGGVVYLSMGQDDLDSVFFGYRREDLITIGGKSGQGKTWCIVFLALELERVVLAKEKETGETYGDILFVTNEMSDDEIKERMDCIRFSLPFERFNGGSLTSREKKRYYAGLEGVEKTPSKIRIVPSCQSIDELTTLLGIYQPSAVFLDGSYLMESRQTEGWEKIAYITRNLKRIAKSFKTPIINTTQLRRGSGKTGSKFALDGQDDFAYGSSFVQDSDIAIRMFQTADMKYNELVGLEVVKGRRAPAGTTLTFQNDLTNMVHSITKPVEKHKPEITEEVLDEF